MAEHTQRVVNALSPRAGSRGCAVQRATRAWRMCRQKFKVPPCMMHVRAMGAVTAATAAAVAPPSASARMLFERVEAADSTKRSITCRPVKASGSAWKRGGGCELVR
eukprot:2269982-Pleurochrysis_carterae.AAC.4